MSLTAAGNTYNPCLLLLRDKGYVLSTEQADKRVIWCAEKNSHTFTAFSPPELLGIVVLWESQGAEWNRQQPDILGEVLDSSSD
jgi:hypothetical protein